MNEWTKIYFDGAAEPTNPVPAAGAAVIDLPNGNSHTVTVDLGVQTNNVAKYSLLWIPRSQNSRADAAVGAVLKVRLPPVVEIPSNLYVSVHK